MYYIDDMVRLSTAIAETSIVYLLGIHSDEYVYVSSMYQDILIKEATKALRYEHAF